MTEERLLAFSDGVIAILLTIMILELRPPEGTSIGAIHDVLPKMGAYLLSFVLVGIYWANHHHMFKTVKRIDGAVIWANMSLLFSLSLVAFATAWFGEHPGSKGPAFWYAAVQLLCAITYTVLTRTLLRLHPAPSAFATALGEDRKGKLSTGAYVIALGVAPFTPWVTIGLIAAVAVVWLVPDRRFARVLGG